MTMEILASKEIMEAVHNGTDLQWGDTTIINVNFLYNFIQANMKSEFVDFIVISNINNIILLVIFYQKFRHKKREL